MVSLDQAALASALNDWSQGRSPDEAGCYLERVRQFYPDVPMTVLEPLWRGPVETPEAQPNSRGLTLDDYRRALRDLEPRFARTVLLSRERLLPAEPSFFIDGIHPTTEGHQIYGQQVAVALRRHHDAGMTAP